MDRVGAETEDIMVSIAIPDEVRAQYDVLAQATGQALDTLIVSALREVVERRLHEIALIQEGLDAAQAGRITPLDEVTAEYLARGLITPADLAADPDGADMDPM
jgi:predicted transcriptional regulator